jgi:branched-chain amino acid transport system substrate-binding protein
MLVVLTAAVAIASGCGGEKAPEDQGIKIGFYGATTGPTATFALSGRNGASLAVEQLNSAGGVLGKKIVLLSEDDRGEASEAASAVSKLITRDHVVALIGEQASSRTLAAAPIAQSYGVPMISPTSTNVEVTKKGEYIFRACFIDAYQGARWRGSAARRSRPAAPRCCTISPSTTAGTSRTCSGRASRPRAERSRASSSTRRATPISRRS